MIKLFLLILIIVIMIEKIFNHIFFVRIIILTIFAGAIFFFVEYRLFNKLVFFLLYTTYIGATIIFIQDLKKIKKKTEKFIFATLVGILAIATLIVIVFAHIHYAQDIWYML